MLLKIKRCAGLFLALSLFLGGFWTQSFPVQATLEELEEEAEARKALPIQSNEIDNWPTGPQVSAQAAILMDANTGVILYSKNIHERLYPASTFGFPLLCHLRA